MTPSSKRKSRTPEPNPSIKDEAGINTDNIVKEEPKTKSNFLQTIKNQSFRARSRSPNPFKSNKKNDRNNSSPKSKSKSKSKSNSISNTHYNTTNENENAKQTKSKPLFSFLRSVKLQLCEYYIYV